MTQPKRQNPPSVAMVGSGQSLCGSCGLSDWRKQAVFDHNANMELACYGGKLAAAYLDKS